VVFLEDSGKAVERMIETGITDRDRVQVTSGLALGDRLIVEGHTKLTNRETVVVR
jgi:multidrug efflux pump subunit AcrA (membrane-fusion protein)